MDNLTLQTLRTLCTVLVALALTACRPTLTATPASLARADSLVLDRSPCFGRCPVYRLSLHADGSVMFTPLPPSDTTRTASDSILPTQFEGLLHEAERIGFFGLPPIILDDHTFCPVAATDHPTATVTVFRADSVNRVVDYQGCRAGNDTSVVARLEALRHFESAIDSVAGSERWIRPARRR